MNERPVCHRAEDLISYLYDEATPIEARDFAEHIERCDACRAEFATFRQVHESIVLWRNEALGSAVDQAPDINPLLTTRVIPSQFARYERKLSAVAALREFFSVSPLWLRGATVFAALTFCLLAALAVSRLWRQPSQVFFNNSDQKLFTKTELDATVRNEVEKRMAALGSAQGPTSANAPEKNSRTSFPRHQNSTRSQLARMPQTRLTRQEREQLAADLRLIPGKEDELPFVFPDEPNP